LVELGPALDPFLMGFAVALEDGVNSFSAFRLAEGGEVHWVKNRPNGLFVNKSFFLL
jgi:hypothetical protein